MAAENIQDDRLVIFFDIDNTLYSSSLGILSSILEKVQAYIVSLGFSDEHASKLRTQYLAQYGLVIRGLVLHHGVDPMDFEQKCFASVPLEDVLSPDPLTRKLLQAIDRSKCRIWAFTNSYRIHAERVLRLIDLHDQFEGIVFCDYNREDDLVCKPAPASYHRAMQQAGVQDPTKCLFVDDSLGNLKAAKAVGWIRCVHFREHDPTNLQKLGVNHTPGGQEELVTEDGIPMINNLQQLRNVWPEIFVQARQ